MAGNQPRQKPLEDIFAETDRSARSVQRGAVQPAPASRQEVLPPTGAVARRTSAAPLEALPRPWYLRRAFLLIALPLVIVAGVAAVIALGPFGIGGDDSSQTNSGTANAGNSSNSAVVTSAGEIPLVTSDRVDTDGDGLTDTEEAAADTDPSQSDTDRDGLYDHDEVKVYQTNPRNPDTDGDGNNDGTEVKNGFDPKGSGMLRDLNAAIQELNNS